MAQSANLNKSVCQSTLNKTFRLQEHDFKGWLSKSGNSIWKRTEQVETGAGEVEENLIFPLPITDH